MLLRFWLSFSCEPGGLQHLPLKYLVLAIFIWWHLSQLWGWRWPWLSAGRSPRGQSFRYGSQGALPSLRWWSTIRHEVINPGTTVMGCICILGKWIQILQLQFHLLLQSFLVFPQDQEEFGGNFLWLLPRSFTTKSFTYKNSCSNAHHPSIPLSLHGV